MRAFRKQDYFFGEDTVSVRRLLPEQRHTKNCEEHTHEFFEFVYVEQGEGVHLVDGKEIPVKRGSLLFINFGQTHAFQMKNAVYYNILLLPEFLGLGLAENTDAVYDLFSLVLESGDTAKVDFSAKDTLVVDGLVHTLYREFRDKPENYRTALSDLLHYLILLVLRKLREGRESDGREDHRITEVIEYLKRHATENPGLQEVSDKFFYNASYLSRLFKQFTGVGFRAYINSLKIERALELLRDTTLTNEEIAELAGFGDVKSFYVQLKKFTGSTPSQIRKQ